MKLSEVIKVIEDGKEREFKNDGFKARYNFDLDCIEITLCAVATALFPLDGWEEVKPPRQWSDDEVKITKMFNWVNWITKTEIGDVLLTEEKPTKDNFDFSISGGKMIIINKQTLESGFVSTITKEESPVYIGDLKGE